MNPFDLWVLWSLNLWFGPFMLVKPCSSSTTAE